MSEINNKILSIRLCNQIRTRYFEILVILANNPFPLYCLSYPIKSVFKHENLIRYEFLYPSHNFINLYTQLKHPAFSFHHLTNVQFWLSFCFGHNFLEKMILKFYPHNRFSVTQVDRLQCDHLYQN